MPNLLVSDLFMVQALNSFQGYITYMEYSLTPAKGEVADGTVIQNPFYYSPMTEARSNFTSARTVEAVTAGSYTPAWGPVKKGAFQDCDSEGNSVQHLDIKDGYKHDVPVAHDVKFLAANGSFVAWGDVNSDGTVTVPAGAAKMAYLYDNEVIPQDKIPTIKGRMRGLSLEARARRIGVEYSQFAAYQA